MNKRLQALKPRLKKACFPAMALGIITALSPTYVEAGWREASHTIGMQVSPDHKQPEAKPFTDQTFENPLLEWQAAYVIDDTTHHLKLAQALFEKEPNALHASLWLRSLSKNNQLEQALELLKGTYKDELILKYPEALRDFAWQTLYLQMQGASVEQVSLILNLLHLVKDIRMSPLVLTALSHEDLRLNMQALDLVESYPLDIYRESVLSLWQRSSNSLLKARIFSLASHLRWAEAEEMAKYLKKEAESASRETIILLADYEMIKSKLDMASLQAMAEAEPIIPVRMAAWCLRYQSLDKESLARLYEKIFLRQDSLATLLALDTLLHFHISIYPRLEMTLSQIQKNWQDSLLEDQIEWIRSVALGEKERLKWLQKQLGLQDHISASSHLAWVFSTRFEDPQLLSFLWQRRERLKKLLQLQAAWAMVQTRSKHAAGENQEAIDYVCDWILKGSDYWLIDSGWPGFIELSEKPPSWLPTVWIRESASRLRLNILSDLALTESEKAYRLVWRLYQKEPEIYLPALMNLAWSQGRSLSIAGVCEDKEVRLLRALIGFNEEDKRWLQQEFFKSSDIWKQQIMQAMLQLADQSDLDFFTQALSESTRLSIKSASGILIALRQGNRPKNEP
jgi:hypothetical protein